MFVCFRNRIEKEKRTQPKPKTRNPNPVTSPTKTLPDPSPGEHLPRPLYLMRPMPRHVSHSSGWTLVTGDPHRGSAVADLTTAQHSHARPLFWPALTLRMLTDPIMPRPEHWRRPTACAGEIRHRSAASAAAHHAPTPAKPRCCPRRVTHVAYTTPDQNSGRIGPLSIGFSQVRRSSPSAAAG